MVTESTEQYPPVEATSTSTLPVATSTDTSSMQYVEMPLPVVTDPAPLPDIVEKSTVFTATDEQIIPAPASIHASMGTAPGLIQIPEPDIATKTDNNSGTTGTEQSLHVVTSVPSEDINILPSASSDVPPSDTTTSHIPTSEPTGSIPSLSVSTDEATPVVTSETVTEANLTVPKSGAVVIPATPLSEVTPPMTETALHVVTAPTKSTETVSKEPPPLIGKYYKVMTVEGDDIVHISHTDIVNRECTVKLDRLSHEDIDFIRESFAHCRTQYADEDDEPVRPWASRRKKPVRARAKHHQPLD